MRESKVAIAKRKSEPLDVIDARFEAPRAGEVRVRIVDAARHRFAAKRYFRQGQPIEEATAARNEALSFFLRV